VASSNEATDGGGANGKRKGNKGKKQVLIW
jgi:hypothetical protein